MLGVLLCYFLVFPLTFRFLATYQVAGDVANMISLDSYISTLLGMSLMLGVVFEMPVLCWLFAKLGFLKASFMQNYRKHAVVVILIVAAIITPTSDAITLSLVSVPMWLLYELSVKVVAKVEKDKN
jgi:sec-independent protein translocase protein TatC